MPKESRSGEPNHIQRFGAPVTEKLDARRRRSPDFAAEIEALHVLTRALNVSDTEMLQTLVDIALKLCNAGSAGISLRERNARQPQTFRWVALAGQCAGLVGHLLQSDDSPAAVTLELGSPQLFAFPKRQFDCLAIVTPEVTEELVVPVPGTPEPWGALWVMAHDEHLHFDSEHRRILTSLANFTCAALTIKQAKADAEARAEDAEAARNALSAVEAHQVDFIATLGHELRNPLAPIDTALAAAQKLAAGNAAVLSALAVANRQVRQLKRLVSDLLDTSRIRHGKLSVRPAIGLLGDIVKDAMAAVTEEAERRQQQLHVTLPAYPVTVFADAARLTQVVSNLLSNAVKYTPTGGEITLRVDAPDPGTIPEDDSTLREAIITLRDNGMGIAPDVLPHIFDMFAQSPSARTRAQGGLGVGLSVVRYLVNAHRGEIAVRSEGEGTGTEVTVRLPIVCRTQLEHAAATTHGISPARILLVDDNADATEALAMLLTLDGHEVKRAQTGLEALSIVESFMPDIALIDINMPGMDGHELARLLREREQCSSTRLVALSGYAWATSDPAAGESGFDCHLIKPPSLEDLADVLRGLPDH
ncbi:hybrid sensor histidine kinase/response regulator [Paraburkholderia sacchari]|uniref:histidine kinase n=1 Tax=Paraburkholderia sacchari TaxID=159450 RepID=A0A8T6Z8J8_9BURK|nr:hybrid sensor histidine kinase/response regulator [Paraburkholderia sacchari]NLP60534.1 response regulator [Paraburkholderia sacchari]